MNCKHKQKVSHLVKPIHLDLYQKNLLRAKELTYPGYIDEALTLLNTRGQIVNRGEIENTSKGVKKSWIILNAILATVGLPEVSNFETVSEIEIAQAFNLQKIA
jgi:hypothetical protein